MKNNNLSPDEIWESLLKSMLTLQEKINGLEAQVKELHGIVARPASELILDDVDVRRLLKICRRTSLEYRQNEILRFHKENGKIFYILEELLEDIKKLPGNKK